MAHMKLLMASVLQHTLESDDDCCQGGCCKCGEADFQQLGDRDHQEAWHEVVHHASECSGWHRVHLPLRHADLATRLLLLSLQA